MTKRAGRASPVIVKRNIITISIIFQSYIKANIYIAAFLIADNLL